jgi:prolyl-tRNA synthetase
LKEGKSIEVGNIFQFGDKYAKDMNGYADDSDGQKKPILMASYGIGISRLVATIVEKYADQKGIIWPEAVAPFQVHLISLKEDEKAEKVYQELLKNNIEVLYDDRDIAAGAKFADADLLGMPYRLVVSSKAGEKIEVKKRNEDTAELMDLAEVMKILKK